MKRIGVFFLSLMVLVGCKNYENYKMENQINDIPFYASSIQDDSGQENLKLYKIKAYVTDEYYLDCSTASTLNLYDKKGKIIKENAFDSIVFLTKGENYFLEVKTYLPNEKFLLELKPMNNKIVTPYEIEYDVDLSKYSTKTPKKDPLVAAKVDYKKREGGTYLYSNMPEKMPSEVVNTIIMQQKNLTGECMLAFEHSNMTNNANIYMGYRLTNQEEHDIYVTITNIGYQTDGSWLGEKAWMDYYGVKFEMDFSHFRTDKFNYEGKIYTAQEWYNAYLNFDSNYVPTAIEPITYKIPAGEHFYVIGGTSKDSYNNINVHNTADIKLAKGFCMNGNVKFTIHNGKATGDLCVYDDIDYINSGMAKIQNVRWYGEGDDYGGRLGYSPIHGVVENSPVWQFSDDTSSQFLPVTYQAYYADELKDSYLPQEEVTDCYNHTVKGQSWFTHFSAQYHHNHCGSDMIDMYAYQDNKLITFSNYIANPAGNVWDFGNWMIEYQDDLTFINRGDTDRKIQLYLINGGSVYYNVKNLDGDILKSGLTLTTISTLTPIYECYIPAHSSYVISLQYVLPANSTASVQHRIQLV